jgi:hypothetical protein
MRRHFSCRARVGKSRTDLFVRNLALEGNRISTGFHCFCLGNRRVVGERAVCAQRTLSRHDGSIARPAGGAVLRWLAMSLDPAPLAVLCLQILHGASFGATYLGAVLFLGGLAGPNHRARMQGLSSAAMALSTALATAACGRLTGLYGERSYLAMVGLASLGFLLALLAAARWQGSRHEK